MASSAAQLERRVARALSLEVAELSGEELRGEILVVFFCSSNRRGDRGKKKLDSSQRRLPAFF